MNTSSTSEGLKMVSKLTQHGGPLTFLSIIRDSELVAIPSSFDLIRYGQNATINSMAPVLLVYSESSAPPSSILLLSCGILENKSKILVVIDRPISA